MAGNARVIRVWGRILVSVALILGVRPGGLAGQAPKVVELRPADPVSVPAEIRLPDGPPVYALLATDQPPKIDGKLDDPVWQNVPAMGRMFLDTGEGAMRYDTTTRMVRDKQYLYIAVDCQHPNIAEVKMVKGARDRVYYGGETIELFLHTDQSIRDYVHVIFDMSGAFTDQRVYDPGLAGRTSDVRPLDMDWNGDIVAATDVGGTGWRLETRLRIADLAVGGKIHPHVWGANIARNSRSQSGSWARIRGRYHQPEAFGLLTMCEGGLAVEDISAGALALPDPKEKASAVHLRLRSLGKSEQPLTIHLSTAGGKGEPVRSDERINLGVAGASDVLSQMDLSDAETLEVALEMPGGSQVFGARLPILRKPGRTDTVSTERFRCAVRPMRAVAFNPDEAKVHLLAWSKLPHRVVGSAQQHTGGQAASGTLKDATSAAATSGRLVLVSQWTGKDIWQVPVSMDLPAGGFASAMVSLPVELMKDGQYEVRWIPDEKDATQRAVSAIEYAQVDVAVLRAFLSPPDLEHVLAKMDCPVPQDPRDRALVTVRIERLAGRIAEPPPGQEPDSPEQVLAALRQLREVVQVLREQGHYVKGRRGWLENAFFSTVDNSAQPYSLSVPSDYDKDPDRKWPLVIGLHGGGSTHGGENGYTGSPEVSQYFYLLPLGRGPRVGFSRVSAVDVIQAILDVEAHYQVDPDAVFLFGGSMGGYGAYEIASHWPDIFAACRPLCGGGAWLPLEQMCNLPTVIHHGLQDMSVASCHSRFVAARMNAAGCPVQMYLHPTYGHLVTPMGEKISPWSKFREMRRDLQPRTVVVDSDLPMLRKAYWLSIPRPVDPQQDAYLRATFLAENHLALSARNVEWAKVALPLKWVKPAEALQITTDGGEQWTEIVTGDAKALYMHWEGGKLAATTQPSVDVEDPGVYTGGGAHNLFWLGRPIRIVYGTAGSAEQGPALQRLAESIRKYHVEEAEFQVGGYPLLKDVEVTEQVLKTCDLILLGSPQDNALVGRMAAQLPVKFVDGQVVVEATPRMQWEQDKVAFSLFYRNPLQTGQRIWWISGAQDRDGFVKLVRATDGRMFGLRAPELIVQNRDGGAVLATARLSDDWKLSRPGPLRAARDIWPARADMDKDLGEFLRKLYVADVSLIGVVPPGETVAWESLTAGEALLFAQKRMMAIVSLSGEELRKWHPARVKEFDEWKLKEYQQAWAGPTVDSLDLKKTYRVLLSVNEGSSLEEKAIHPRYVRFLQEGDFEQALRRFVGEKGLDGGPGGDRRQQRPG